MNRVNFTGEQIGPYYIRERVGQGGMADVYRAYQPSVKREVALKVIPLIASAEHELLQQRFKREAEMIAVLEHPHILPVFDYGIANDMLYLAMRLLRGGTLRELLTGEVMSISRVGDLLAQVASALGYAHRRGVIHRDLKPSNILLDDEGNAYLADFGLAKVLGGSSQLTTTGSIIGTPAYMSPEQLRGDPINHRSDIYSLGVILYHMVVGRPPFEALTTFSLIYQHVEKEPPPPRAFNPAISPAVESVILRALQKSADERFESAEQMAAAFEAAIGRKEPPEAAAVPPPPPDVIILQSTTPTPTPPAETTPPSALPAVSVVASTGSGTRGSDTWRSVPRLIGLAVPALLVLVAFFVILIVQQGAPQTLAPPTIVAGQEGVSADVSPSEDEIARARQHLGPDGFVAYIVCNMESEFFARQARTMSDVAASYGLDYRWYDSETDPNRQIIQIERARTEGAKALVVCVVDEDVVNDTLESALEAGIPVVLQNIDEPSFDGSVLVAIDNFLLGQLPGRYAGQVVADENGGMADVIILDFPDLPAIEARADGLESGFLEYAPQANIVGRYLGGTADFAEESVRVLLVADVHFDVILSINDSGAYGAIAALEDADIDPSSVLITGVDAEALTREHIRDGYFMRVSVNVEGGETSRTAIDAAVKLLAGSTLPQIILVPPGNLVTMESLAVE